VLGYVAKDLSVPKAAGCDKLFVCSTQVIDRTAEVIEQRGWELGRFGANPVMLACHMHRLADGRSPVIGSWPYMEVLDDAKVAGAGKTALVGGAKFAATELGKEYKSLYDDGHMRAVSVGFIPIKGEYRKVSGGQVYVHTAQELVEVSAVAVGANPEALARMFQAAGALGLTAELRQELGDLVKARTEAAVKSAIDNLLTTIDARFSGLSAQVADGISNLVEILELSSDSLGQDSPPATEAPAGGETPPEADENGALGKAVKDLLKTCRT